MSKDRQKISGDYYNRERQAAVCVCVCVLLHDRRRILQSGGGRRVGVVNAGDG